MKPQADDSLNLLLTLEQPGQERLFRAGAGSIAVHLVFGFFFLLMLRLDASRPPAQAIPEDDLRKFTPLVDPPMHMTQPEPNVNKPSLEVNLQSLLSRPQPNAAPAHMRFRAPQPVQTPGPAVPTIAPPPNIETALKSPGAGARDAERSSSSTGDEGRAAEVGVRNAGERIGQAAGREFAEDRTAQNERGRGD